MNLKEFIHKNKVYSALLGIFLLWTLYLIILAITAHREVFFYDYLSQENVNGDYSSEVPLLRYFIEPIVGAALIIEGYDLAIGFVYTAIIYRLGYFHAKQKGKWDSEKAKLLWYPVKEWIRFSFILMSVSLISGLLLVLCIFLFAGFFYVNLYWMTILLIAVFSNFIAIGVKGVIILVKFFHPKLKLYYGKLQRFNRPAPRSKREKYFRSFRREFVYVITFSVLLSGIGMVLLTAHLPMHTIETDLDDDEVLLDFHVHTFMSDGWLSPQHRVDWYIAHGIQGAAFSDHDNLRGAEIARRYVKEKDLEFTVFYSEEWTDHENGIHMNIFGLEETIVPLESEAEGGAPAMNAEDTIEYVKKEGGYVVVNHYNYNENPEGGFGTPYSLEDLMEWGVDGFEIINGGHPKHYKIREFCLNNSLACIAGSDIHTNKELNTITKIRLNDTEDLDLDEIFKVLKKNEHEAIGINMNPKDVRLHALFHALELGYIEEFIEYLLNLNALQILSWILWTSGGFSLLTVLYLKAKRLDIETLRQKIL